LTFTFKQPTTIEILPVLESDNIRLMSLESGDGIRPALVRPAGFRPSDRRGRIPIGWPDGSGQPVGIRPLWPDPAKVARIRPFVPDSGHFRRNPTILDSDETVRIPAFISNSGYISQNQVKMVKILSLVIKSRHR
jgi:hypothetical protein